MFIAHALSGVYDSVSHLNWRPNPEARYRSVQIPRTSGPARKAPTVDLRVKPEHIEDDQSHISDLIVTGSGRQTVEALKKVQDRIDGDTNICVVHDGLGVLESVRQEVFAGIKGDWPTLYGGHMSHKLALGRNRYGVLTQLRPGNLAMFCRTNPRRIKTSLEVTRTGPDFVKSLEDVPELGTMFGTYTDWLGLKLPSVVFQSVVEPICVMFEASYHEIFHNQGAMKMMSRLLAEILDLIRILPEAEGSDAVRTFVSGDEAFKTIVRQMNAKKGAPSEMRARLERGLSPETEHTIQWLRRRGAKLGMDMPVTSTLIDYVHARKAQLVMERDAEIPMEYTSRPHFGPTGHPLPTKKTIRRSHGLYY